MSDLWTVIAERTVKLGAPLLEIGEKWWWTLLLLPGVGVVYYILHTMGYF